MPFSTAKFLKFRSGMQKRIGSLRSKTEDSLEFAVDTMMEERVDGFFHVEQGLEEIIKSLVEIEDELEAIRDLAGAMRLESRLEFVEERWDEFDSEIRERPRRRRKRVSLADMLKAASGTGQLSENPHAVNNAMDAYAIMGVEFGSSCRCHRLVPNQGEAAPSRREQRRSQLRTRTPPHVGSVSVSEGIPQPQQYGAHASSGTSIQPL
jgi:hypothetical protein